RLLSAVKKFDASDLHLVAGVPPAFRVNGEIIIADEDALTEQEVEQMANGLLNEQQKKKFEQEWEVCISVLHPALGPFAGDFLWAQRASGNEPEILRGADREPGGTWVAGKD